MVNFLSTTYFDLLATFGTADEYSSLICFHYWPLRKPHAPLVFLLPCRPHNLFFPLAFVLLSKCYASPWILFLLIISLLWHLIQSYYCASLCVSQVPYSFFLTKATPSISKMIMTCFIVTVTLLQCSDTEPAISLKYACRLYTDNSKI